MADNITKILSYLTPFTAEKIDFNGKVIAEPVNTIKLAGDFFTIDGCELCGYCCLAEHNVYTQFEYEAIMNCTDEDIINYGFQIPIEPIHELKEGLTKATYKINGKDVNLYTFKGTFPVMYLERRGGERQRCHFVHQREDGKVICGIHPVRSITCRVPHMRVYNSSAGNTSIHNSQYGRNWALKCPVTFPEPTNEEEFNRAKNGKLETLRYLVRIAEDMNVKTYVPQIVAYVESCTFENYKSKLETNLLAKKTKHFINLD